MAAAAPAAWCRPTRASWKTEWARRIAHGSSCSLCSCDKLRRRRHASPSRIPTIPFERNNLLLFLFFLPPQQAPLVPFPPDLSFLLTNKYNNKVLIPKSPFLSLSLSLGSVVDVCVWISLSQTELVRICRNFFVCEFFCSFCSLLLTGYNMVAVGVLL